MRTTSGIRTPIVVAAVLCVAAPIGHAQQTAPSEATDETIARLIDELGAGSHRVRSDATTQLLSVGPRATAALMEAARGDDFEVALRSRHLLSVFQQLLFNGVLIQLNASKTTIAWSDPVSLVVRMHNPTAHPARVPVELSTPRSDKPKALERQVIRLLDLADYLRVTDPDGKVIRLHVDDINEDERLLAAVNARVDHPASDALGPGDEAVYEIEEFNRGWARYRLLRRGVYRVQLVYDPVWNDEALRAAGIGRAISNVLEITVAKPAPPQVRDTGPPASIRLQRAGQEAVALLVNHSDVSVWVNLNLGSSPAPPLASLRWYRTCNDVREERTPAHRRGTTRFSRDLIRKVRPGDTLELGRMPLAELADPADDCELSVTYCNIAGLAWQRSRAGGQPGIGHAFPHRMLVTTLTGKALPIPASEEARN